MSDDPIYLRHILDAIAWIERYVSCGSEKFFEDHMIQDAVIRQLSIIGEAVKNLTPELLSEYPDVPWKLIARARDVFIHAYFRVDLLMIWGIIEKDLPPLKSAVGRILDSIEKRA